MLGPACAFIDLETTGTVATGDRITEIGIVRVIDGRLEEEWSTLVNPECSIPPEIQRLTGITNAMVTDAPTFAEIRHDVLDRLEDHLFIAHNARFDYGFIKNEFRRAGTPFSADVLCTVRLSRRLYPEHRHHGLDAIVDRHLLSGADRHRALGDARLIWEFVQALYREISAEEIEAAVRQLLKTPSLPPQLPADALKRLPEGPGVYLFYGVNDLPLYVGKSRNLRERVRSHFSSDHLSANDLRLSSEVTHIEFEQTAGELGALLREAQLVKTLLPHHNHRLRRRVGVCALCLPEEPGPPEFVTRHRFMPRELDGLFGPFASRRAAKTALMDLAAEHGLCWSRLGLERRNGPCFARQLGRCRGACIGAEAAADHHARLRAALNPFAIAPWPFAGPIGIREASEDGREELHLIDRWCHIGTARAEHEIAGLLESPPQGFDLDIYRIISAFLAKPGRSTKLFELAQLLAAA
ncbi:MAG: exonuclease domain-containing protein [Burkholderiales bacterium]